MCLKRTLAPAVTLLLLLAPDLARSDGELDTSFAGSGILVQDLGSPSDHVAGMKIAPGGRIVVAGDTLGTNNRDLTVLAFTPQGQLDTSFAGTGKVTADFGGNEEATGLAIDRDGSIVVVGTRAKDGLFEVVIVKYLSNGSLDTSFNGTGRRVLAFSDGANNFGNAVALELDGRIVIGGTRTNANGSVFAIARLRKNGSFDTSLDGNGKKFIDFGVASGRNVFGNAVAVQDDRKIVIAGRRVAAGGTDFALARIHPDGTLDAGFGSNGKTDVEFGGVDEAYAIALRPEGRIVVVGTRRTASGSDFAVALLRTNGSLDTSFKGNGKASTDFGADEKAYAVVVQPDGKMLVAGERQGERIGRDYAIARYLEDGSLDSSLDADGKARVDVANGSSDIATGVDLQADGRIVIAGTATSGSNSNLGLVRLLSSSPPQRGALEIPGGSTFQSGIGLVSGWHCTGPTVRVRIDGQPLLTTAYGTARADTLAACGDTNNGFGLLFNWSLLSDGPHIIRAFAQGQEFASAVFEVRSLGVPFLRGASGTYTLPNFPRTGRSVDVTWAEALQGFVITNATGGAAQSATGTIVLSAPARPLATNGLLENPSDGSFQSGVGLISGWVCDANNVQILIDDRPALQAAYGTARGDTEAVCGDTDNGFGLLFNWNLLGDGTHTLIARADGQVFASATFTVTTLGASFLRGASGAYTLPDFPEAGRSVDISWAEAQQNFVIVDRD